MQTQVETIIDELYAVDPTLKEHEASIRALVTTLTGAKPDVTVRDDFFNTLRRELLTRASERGRRAVPASPSPFFWWVVRLAPLGATLLLLLTLLPEPSPRAVPPEYRGGQVELEMSSDAVLKTSTVAPESVQNENLRSALTLETVTLPYPGFVVVYHEVSGVRTEVVGVSGYLLPGTTVGVRIGFLRSVYGDEPLVSVFFRDDGDGIFTESDTLGTPLYIPLD